MKTDRYLDGLEELFWLYEQSSSFAPVFCIELEGKIPNPNWRDHLRALQSLYPLLRCRIQKRSGERARFEEVPALEIPLTTKSLDASMELEMQRELDRGFHHSDHALVRLTVCGDGDRAFVLIAAQHAAFDGRSIIMMIDDLLALAAGEQVDVRQRAASSIGELFSMGTIEGYFEALSGDWNFPPRNRVKPSSVVRKVLSEKQTAIVLANCKNHGVSVSAGLTAAVAEAGRGIEAGWRRRALNSLVPVDLRPFFDADQASGLLISVLSAAIPVRMEGSVWDLAVDIHRKLENATSTAAFVGQAERLRAAFAREQQHADIMKQLRSSAVPADIAVNNYGKKSFRSEYRAFRLVGASSGSLTSHAGGQKVSIINLDGRITLTGTSVEPIANLLNDAVRIVSEG